MNLGLRQLTYTESYNVLVRYKMKVFLIFLDDERKVEDVTWIKYPPYYAFTIVRDFDTFKESIRNINFENTLFSFDHDIALFDEDGKETSGYDCLKWLCNYMFDNGIPSQHLNAMVHSKNPIGKENIESYIRNFKIHQ